MIKLGPEDSRGKNRIQRVFGARCVKRESTVLRKAIVETQGAN